jgi:hypothetical protein
MLKIAGIRQLLSKIQKPMKKNELFSPLTSFSDFIRKSKI